MSDGTLDLGELERFSQVFTKVADAFVEAGKDAVKYAGRSVRDSARQNIRAQMRRGRAGSSHLKRYPNAITASFTSNRNGIVAEVGPESDKPQGGMGLGVEYGSANTGGKPHLIPAFDDGSEVLMEDLENIVDRVFTFPESE